MKACTRCGETHPLENFPPDKRATDGRTSWCRPCSREANRINRQRPEVQERRREQSRLRDQDPEVRARRAERHRERYATEPEFRQRHLQKARDRRQDPEVRAKASEMHRRWILENVYGLTPEEYDDLLEEQGGHCALCVAVVADARNHPLHVDHDHVTGAVRGLLCSKCNRGLGMFDDDPERISRAAEYLRARSAVEA